MAKDSNKDSKPSSTTNNIKEPLLGTRRDLFAAEEQKRAVLRYLTPEVIDPNPDQPRRKINIEALEDLKRSISERGILQPLLAIRGTEGHVILVAGQRRLLAAKELGLKLVPVMVIDFRPDIAFDAIIENVQREALDPIDEGEAFQRLADERNLSHAEIGTRIGKSKQYVTDRIRLASKLTPRAKELLGGVVVSLQNSQIKTRAFDSEKNHNNNDIPEISEEIILGAGRAKFTIARAVSFLPRELQDVAMQELESTVTRLGRRLTTREVEDLIAKFRNEFPTHSSRHRLPIIESSKYDFHDKPIEMVQMSFIAPEPEQAVIPTNNRSASKKRSRDQSNSPILEDVASVDGRVLESFKEIARLAGISEEIVLRLDLDMAIRLLESDLERLRQLKKSPTNL
jgi:ParB/RepB/Spo0J family partition protein